MVLRMTDIHHVRTHRKRCLLRFAAALSGLVRSTPLQNGCKLDRPRAWTHSKALGPTGWSRNATCALTRDRHLPLREHTTQRIDINGDLRVWSLWSQISVTKHIDKNFEQILSTWLPPSFLFPQLPSAIQTRNVQNYVRNAMPSNAPCDALSDASRNVRMLACTTERERMLETCCMHSVAASLAQVPKVPHCREPHL